MKKSNIFLIGAMSAAMMLNTSCDDRVDCGCDCSFPEITSWALLSDLETMQTSSDSSMVAGSVIVVYGSNMSDITAVKYGETSATLYPAFIDHNQIVYKVPDGMTETIVPKFCTKGCPEGKEVAVLTSFLAPPCVAMCDNEFAKKKINVKGNAMIDGMTAYFVSDAANHSFDVDASKNPVYTGYVQSPNVVLKSSNEAAVEVPEGAVPGFPIVFVSKAGFSESEFIWCDESNLLITYDDEEYLNCFNTNKPEADQDAPEVDKANFVSDNTQGDFALFSGSAEFYQLYFNILSNADVNPNNVEPKYKTVFGKYEKEIFVEGTRNLNDFVVKFEMFVPSGEYMQGRSLTLGFYNPFQTGNNPIGAATYPSGDLRYYSAIFQPARVSFDKPDEGNWKAQSIDKWSTGGDWLTICIPMSEFKYNTQAGAYVTSAENDRRVTDGSADEFTYFGDTKNGASYVDKFAKINLSNLDDLTDDMNAIDDAYYCGFGVITNTYTDTHVPDANKKVHFAIDNLRIVPNTDNNGTVAPYLKWGSLTRDFYTLPVTTCSAKK